MLASNSTGRVSHPGPVKPEPCSISISRCCSRRRRCCSRSGLARDILTAQSANIEGNPLDFLQVTEAYWRVLKASKHEPNRKGPEVIKVRPSGTPLPAQPDYDVVVCGGTLGLMLGATLARRGHKVAVIDKRLIEGRSQEWNISRGELAALSEAGLLTKEEIESCIATEFNPVRVGFAGGPDLWVDDCLNIGVSPKKLLELIKAKFVAAGGTLLENHSFRSAEVVPGSGVDIQLLVHPAGSAGAALSVADVNRPNGLGGNNSNMAPPFTPAESTGATPPASRSFKMQVTSRLLVDCMGHYSDIVKQMRGRAKPDGMCLVVGSCATGFTPSNGSADSNNTFGDLLYTIDDAKDDLQMFWEAFPAEGGAARTTYAFAYSDVEPSRPSFESLLDRYFEGLAAYQGVPATELEYKRVLFGGFPCFSDGPLQPQWDHVIQVGDASATQSPLSFGGFGAMLRHLGRLTEGLDDALRCGALAKDDLQWLHPYQPSLSASWLFQRSMSVGVGQLHKATQQQQQGAPSAPPANTLQLPANHVNEVLATNFQVMQRLGDRVLRPFLQDTIQLGPLSLSMAGMMLANPIAISRVLLQVGPKTLVAWFGHYLALLAYTALHAALTPLRSSVRSEAAQGRGNPEATHGDGLTPSSDVGRSKSGFWLRRFFDMLEFGSSSDYKYHATADPPVPPINTMFSPATTPVAPQQQLHETKTAARVPEVMGVPVPEGRPAQVTAYSSERS